MSAEDRNPSPPPIEVLESDEELELLHVDQIEGTAFSKKWTLNILLNLAKEVDKEQDGKDEKELAEAEAHGIDIPDDLENELCKLWDMSTNMEVSKYLEEWTCVAILVDVIMKSNAPRVVEICMGILGNMACVSQIALNFSENKPLRDLVLATLGSSDAQTLIETTRLIMSCLCNHGAQELWLSAISCDEDVFNKLCFILKSSTNVDLIHATSNLVDKILDVDEEILMDWANSTFIQAIAEAMKQVRNDKPQTASILLHTLQLLSTTDMGVETLVECTETILPLVTTYISSVCDSDDFLCIHGNENSIAGAVSILDVLANTSPPNIDAVLKHDKQTLGNLLHILSASKSADPAQKKPDAPIVNRAKKSRRPAPPPPESEPTSTEDNDNTKSNSKNDASSSSGGAPTQSEDATNDAAPAAQSEQASEEGANSETKDATATTTIPAQDATQSEESTSKEAPMTVVPVDDDDDDSDIEEIGVVSKASTVLTDVLMEFFCNLLENTTTEEYPDFTSCLDQCDKTHVEVWKKCISEEFPGLLDTMYQQQEEPHNETETKVEQQESNLAPL